MAAHHDDPYAAPMSMCCRECFCRRCAFTAVWALALVLLCAGIALAAPRGRQSDSSVIDPFIGNTRIVNARALGGVNPARAITELKMLREQAMATDNMALRWAADATECRLLLDMDVEHALEMTHAGLSLPPPADTAPLSQRAAHLELRSCAAAALLQRGNATEGSAVLEAVLRDSGGLGLEGVQAMTLADRGSHRSRNGDLVNGQNDLLQACNALQRLHWDAQWRDCFQYLANHYTRVHEFDVALRYQNELLTSAKQRGARHDEGIILFNIGRVQFQRGEQVAALESFHAARRIAVDEDDVLGMAYCDNAIGETLLSLQRPAQALPYLQRAVPDFQRMGDSESEAAQVNLASALAQLGKYGEALALLNKVEPMLEARHAESTLIMALAARTRAEAGEKHWQHAFEAQTRQLALLEKMSERRQSEQAARLRLQYGSEKDEADLKALQAINARDASLQRAQAIALTLALSLLLAMSLYVRQKIRATRHLRVLAMMDELTKLSNRRAIMAVAEDLLAQARMAHQPLSALVVDIDRFKQINDALGHHNGDVVLQQVATLMGSALRPRDAIGRMGGEEFLVLLPGTPETAAEVIAERIRTVIASSPIEVSSQKLTVTVSVGFATARPGDTLVRLLDRADGALYRAKMDGRNRVCVSNAMVSGWWAAFKAEKAHSPRHPAPRPASITPPEAEH